MNKFSVCVMLLLVGCAACKKSGGDNISAETVEKDIRSTFEGMKPTKVSCPDGVKKEQGGTFECTVDAADGNKVVIEVRIGSQFRYEIKTITTPDGKSYTAKEYQELAQGEPAKPDGGDETAGDDGRAEATMEARAFVMRLYQGAFEFYADASGEGPAEFPGPSQGPTPPLGTCCKNSDRQCQPDESLWAKPPWIMLQFSVDDPHYYSYSYKTDGQSFTVSAYGDLDCDGQYSTFELRGDAKGPGEVKPTVTNELE